MSLTKAQTPSYPWANSAVSSLSFVSKNLNSIPYSDNPEAIVNRISTILSEFLDFTVEVDFNYTDDTKEIMEISLKVVGLPGVVKAGVKKTNETIKLINPRYFK